jgi:hypothetical protein
MCVRPSLRPEGMEASLGEIMRRAGEATEAARCAVAETRATDETVRGLAEAAQRIRGVVRLVGEIAEQTGPLVPNAMIQAARAGDADWICDLPTTCRVVLIFRIRPSMATPSPCSLRNRAAAAHDLLVFSLATMPGVSWGGRRPGSPASSIRCRCSPSWPHGRKRLG